MTYIFAVDQISKMASTIPYSIYDAKYSLIYPPLGISKGIQGLASNIAKQLKKITMKRGK